jgi:4-hydroxy-3-methylbut-2-enyl diphosphate reductase
MNSFFQKLSGGTATLISAIIWVLTYLLARWLLDGNGFQGGLRIVVALVPILPFAFFLVLMITGIRQLDELHRKVHLEALKFAREGRTIILIGHQDHDEVIGTAGEAPQVMTVVGTLSEVDDIRVPDPTRVAYLTQTTLSLDDTREIIERLREKFPLIQGPASEDICYATTNRQDAVKALAPRVDVLLVIGSQNSSNSNRLAEVSDERGTAAYLVDDETHVDPVWLAGAETVGLTSGASAPEWLVDRMLAFLASNGFDDVEVVTLAEERVRFSLPAGVRDLPLTAG